MAKSITGRTDQNPIADPQGTARAPHWVNLKYLISKYGMGKMFWYWHRRNGTGPKFSYLGPRTIVYDENIVDEWFESRSVTGLSDPKYRELSGRGRPDHSGNT